MISKCLSILIGVSAIVCILADHGHHGGHHDGYGHGGHQKGHGHHKGHDHHKPAHYKFEYNVKDQYYGGNFGHHESRDGYLTKGKYFVDLPDGRKQTVTYTADKWGYHPKVHYDGKAKFGPSKGHKSHGYGHGGHGEHGKGHGGHGKIHGGHGKGHGGHSGHGKGHGGYH